MNDNNIRRYKRITRVRDFSIAYAADLTPGSRAASLFLELHPIVGELENAAVDQLRGPVGKAELIAALSADFKDFSRTARAIKLDDSAFDDAPYRHPATSVEKPVTTHADSLLKLLEDDTRPVADGGDTAAQLAAKAALRAKFIAYELPEDFVEDLRDDRDAIDDCNSGKHSDNFKGVQSTSAIETLLSNAQTIVSRLDAALQNKYTREPDKLAAWKSASRTERAPKKQKPADPTPPPAA